MTDTARLREYIRQSGYKLGHIAQVMGISANTLRLKLLEESEFKVGEAERLATLLGLTAEERDACFWVPGKAGRL